MKKSREAQVLKKPEILTDEEISKEVKKGYDSGEYDIDLAIDKRIAGAQRDKDAKYYEAIIQQLKSLYHI